MTPAIRAFLRAASDGDANLVRGLLAQGTNVDSPNRAGQTALMLAAGFKQHEVIQVLIAAGANVELQDELGLTATDWAKNDPEVISLFIQRKPTTPQLSEPEQAPVANPKQNVESLPIAVPVVQRPREEQTLKGLAGAILRDHKPRLEEHVQPIGAIPAPAPVQVPTPEPVQTVIPTADDETLDKPLLELSEDTAAPRPSLASRSRIFDLSAAPETPRPLSKVEVSVPEPPRRSRTATWLVLIVLLAIAGVGAYLLTKRFLTGQTTTATEVAKPKPEVPQTAAITKSGPVVTGDLAGAELHLTDAVYPPEAQGQSGTVHVGVQVNQKGIVLAAKAIDGNDLFREAAEKAARGSAFSPDKLAGPARMIEGTITYTFAPVQSSSDKSNQQGVTAVAGGPLSGAERDLIEPEYSAKAKQSGAGGEFTVVVRVNRQGRVMSWRPLHGDDRLREAVIKAAKRSTFSPEKLPGTGEVVGTITYTFN